VQELLSSIGNSFVTTVSADKLKTREELVVEDVPEYLARVERYIAQADQPPLQVLIEAHVLRVVLRDDDQHGVDLTLLARLASANVTLSSNGIASSTASPAFLLNVDSTDLQALVEMIKTTTDAKTLASPKVMAVNGQEARLQIGERLGYLTTTTTQTSTLQDVQFMDLGVVLTVTPVIGRDGQILMTVKPEISSGRINPATGVPDAETTDVETTVLLPNGQGMVIGGLIQEENSDQQSKIPYVGDIPLFGRLFQRRAKVKERSEIIITLLPRIVPYCEPLAQVTEDQQLQRAHTPLTYDR
jgi:type IV pilus assembly protein PilQ